MTPRLVLDKGTDSRENIAKGDAEHVQDLPIFNVDATTFSRWTLTEEERAAIAAGADILVAVLNFGQPLQPLLPITLQPGVAVEPEHLEAIAKQLCGE